MKPKSETLGDIFAKLEDGEMVILAADPGPSVEDYNIPTKEVVRHVSTADRKIPLLERLKTEALLDMVLVLTEVARVKQEEEDELTELMELEEMEEEGFGGWG